MNLGERVVEILQQFGVEVAETGPNVAKGNVNIACPWCGDDPSHHLGINLKTGMFGCWRNSDHRSSDPTRLVATITGWSKQRTRQELGLHSSRELVVDKDTNLGLDDAVKDVFAPGTSSKKRAVSRARARVLFNNTSSDSLRESETPSGSLIKNRKKNRIDNTRTHTREGQGKYPYHEFSKDVLCKVSGTFVTIRHYTELDKTGKIIKNASEYSQLSLFHSYLRFGRHLTVQAIAQYQLVAALSGEFSGRVLIPVRDPWGKWLTFTGRSIYRTTALRYKTLDDARALQPSSEAIWNYYDAYTTGGKVLIVVEGPFDAIAVEESARWYKGGIKAPWRAVALMTATLTQDKVSALRVIRRRFKKVVVVLDVGFELQALALAVEIGATTVPSPTGWGKDLGSTPQKYIYEWIVEHVLKGQ